MPNAIVGLPMAVTEESLSAKEMLLLFVTVAGKEKADANLLPEELETYRCCRVAVGCRRGKCPESAARESKKYSVVCRLSVCCIIRGNKRLTTVCRRGRKEKATANLLPEKGFRPLYDVQAVSRSSPVAAIKEEAKKIVVLKLSSVALPGKTHENT